MLVPLDALPLRRLSMQSAMRFESAHDSAARAKHRYADSEELQLNEESMGPSSTLLPLPALDNEGVPAMHTKSMQYLSPEKSGRLWPRCVPHVLDILPPAWIMTFSAISSAGRKDGQP